VRTEPGYDATQACPERTVEPPRSVAPAALLQEPAAPTVASVLGWQRSAGNQAVARTLSRRAAPADAFRRATSGAASVVPHLARMEAAFGTSFTGVTAYLGGTEARSGLTDLGARAATRGDRIAFAEPSPDEALVAHELAHVVQQRAGGDVQRKAVGVSQVGDAAEARADAASDAVVSGRRVRDVGTAGDAIHRAPVVTNGGSFDTRAYAPISAPTGAVGEGLGAHIELEFKANDLVESTKIGLIQSVKAMKSSTAAGARDTVATGVGDPEEGQLIMGAGEADPGREIDRSVHPGGRAQPNTSPVYGVHNSPASTATALGHGTPTTATSQWGSHTRDPGTGAFLAAVPARIDDTPGRGIEFAGQTYEHTFEAAAIAIEGPIAPNTYLGSVSWGWRSDAVGNVTVDPIALVQAGPPSDAFMGAAERWNAATFHDTSLGALGPLLGAIGVGASTPVGIPITHMNAGSVAAVNMTTSDLLSRLATVTMQIGALTLAGSAVATDLTNKQFEKTALEAELRRRNVKVMVHVVSTEDWTGADEVYVKMIGDGGRATTSRAHDLNDGQAHDFLMPLEPLWPITAPFGIEVYDEDSPDGDDHIVDMSFAPPWTPARNTRSMDDANYEAVAAFER